MPERRHLRLTWVASAESVVAEMLVVWTLRPNR